MLMVLCVLLSVINGSAEEIKVGYFLWPPMLATGKSPDKPVGYLVRHYEEVIAKKLGVTLKWLGPYPIPRTVNMIKHHQVDMIPFMVKSPSREAIMAFPKKHLYTLEAVVCVRKDFRPNIPEKLESWDEIKDIKIGINYGSNFAKTLSKAQPQLNFAYIRHHADPVGYGLKLVQDGKMESYAHPDKQMAKALIKKLKMEKELKLLSAPIPIRYTYTGISLKRPELLEKYNKNIEAITVIKLD